MRLIMQFIMRFLTRVTTRVITRHSERRCIIIAVALKFSQLVELRAYNAPQSSRANPPRPSAVSKERAHENIICSTRALSSCNKRTRPRRDHLLLA
ncbi:unnamed protein product [Trichogramma brassicae]|uniref:Uncharacterized protein n=1 Tax=Trichogramma brassicae TaxID=86971 RepID=A0A6H5HX46_9HYME|nr:unnamed protein product [Trichogramma brassicae]